MKTKLIPGLLAFALLGVAAGCRQSDERVPKANTDAATVRAETQKPVADSLKEQKDQGSAKSFPIK
jgi:hypothetical protein